VYVIIIIVIIQYLAYNQTVTYHFLSGHYRTDLNKLTLTCTTHMY